MAERSSGAALDWDREASIYVRMIRAQGMAKALQYSKPEGNGAKFKEYISHDTVTHEAKRVLIANGIQFAPYIQSFEQDGNRSKVVMLGTFINVDKPNERMEFMGVGYGVDGSDKGPGIAMSYAKKMCLAQALLLDTKDDIENHSNEFQPEMKPDAMREAQALSEAAVRSWADAYRDALRGCRTTADLKRIRAENAPMMQKVPEATRDYFIDMISNLEGTLS